MQRIDVKVGDGSPAGPKPEMISLERRHALHRLWRRWTGLFGPANRAEEQVVTALPATIENSSAGITLRMLVLAEPKDLYIFSDDYRLVVEGWTKCEERYGTSRDSIRESIDRRFQRVYTLPWKIEPGSVHASMTNCVLAITAERKEMEKAVVSIPVGSAWNRNTA